MKKLLIAIAVFIGWILLVYLCMSFALLTMNPCLWDKPDRVFSILLGVFFGLSFAFIDYTETKK